MINGEKEQGCLLITGVKKLFPKTSEKIKLKANYEAKKSVNIKNLLKREDSKEKRLDFLHAILILKIMLLRSQEYMQSE